MSKTEKQSAQQEAFCTDEAYAKLAERSRCAAGRLERAVAVLEQCFLEADGVLGKDIRALVLALISKELERKRNLLIKHRDHYAAYLEMLEE
jgi:hypothetical protein